MFSSMFGTNIFKKSNSTEDRKNPVNRFSFNFFSTRTPTKNTETETSATNGSMLDNDISTHMGVHKDVQVQRARRTSSLGSSDNSTAFSGSRQPSPYSTPATGPIKPEDLSPMASPMQMNVSVTYLSPSFANAKPAAHVVRVPDFNTYDPSVLEHLNVSKRTIDTESNVILNYLQQGQGKELATALPPLVKGEETDISQQYLKILLEQYQSMQTVAATRQVSIEDLKRELFEELSVRLNDIDLNVTDNLENLAKIEKNRSKEYQKHYNFDQLAKGTYKPKFEFSLNDLPAREKDEADDAYKLRAELFIEKQRYSYLQKPLPAKVNLTLIPVDSAQEYGSGQEIIASPKQQVGENKVLQFTNRRMVEAATYYVDLNQGAVNNKPTLGFKG